MKWTGSNSGNDWIGSAVESEGATAALQKVGGVESFKDVGQYLKWLMCVPRVHWLTCFRHWATMASGLTLTFFPRILCPVLFSFSLFLGFHRSFVVVVVVFIFKLQYYCSCFCFPTFLQTYKWFVDVFRVAFDLAQTVLAPLIYMQISRWEPTSVQRHVPI